MENNLKKVCDVPQIISMISGKWKLNILHALHDKSPQRFKELERKVEGITPTMLTKQLKDLESNGLINRKIFATVPPTVEYSLTAHGKTIKPLIHELAKWGQQHLNYINQKAKQAKKNKE